MPNPRTAFCLFCDDIRMEIGNKPSFMGVYTGEMVFPPGLSLDVGIFVSKFAVMWWLFCDKDDRPQHISVRVSIPPGHTEIAKMDVGTEQITQAMPQIFDDYTRLILGSTIPLTNLIFQCSGTIEVSIETERETIRAGRLRVQIPGRPDTAVSATAGSSSEPPTASPLPSEQSPDAVQETKPSRGRRRPSSRRSARTLAPE